MTNAPAQQHPQSSSSSDPERYVPLALILDAVVIFLFVVVGRVSHGESLSVAGVVQTVWPFLVGTALGWVVTLAWRRPLSIVRSGIGIWVATVVVGMLLREASGQGVVTSFVVVASVFVGVFVLGWRAIAGFVVHRAAARPAKERSTAR